jgi:hypothetical protein
MAIRFTCSCGLTLEAEDQYAGQATVCPQCGKQKKIPTPGKPPVAKLVSASPAAPKAPAAPPLPAADAAFEVVEDDEPVMAAPKSKPRPALTMRADENSRPLRRKRAADDDRPRRPRDEEDDDRPRQRKPGSAPARSGTTTKRLWKILGGVGLLVVGLGILTLWWFVPENRKAVKLIIWGVVAVVAGLGGIGAGMFGNVDTGSNSDYDSDDDDD